MALLMVIDDRGESHLVHTSMIGPVPHLRTETHDTWLEVWRRVDDTLPLDEVHPGKPRD